MNSFEVPPLRAWPKILFHAVTKPEIAGEAVDQFVQHDPAKITFCRLDSVPNSWMENSSGPQKEINLYAVASLNTCGT